MIKLTKQKPLVRILSLRTRVLVTAIAGAALFVQQATSDVSYGSTKKPYAAPTCGNAEREAMKHLLKDLYDKVCRNPSEYSAEERIDILRRYATAIQNSDDYCLLSECVMSGRTRLSNRKKSEAEAVFVR